MEERRRTFKYSDFKDKTREELYAYMDEIYPRLTEPDEEGADLYPDDPRRRFFAVAASHTFVPADPVTPEEEAEVEKMWQMMTGGNYTKDPKEKKGQETEKKKRN